MAQMGKQCRRSQGRSAVALPEDLVVWDILVRLPAKDLLRCRAVCRAWSCRISAADFLLAHHQRQPSLLLVASLAPTDVGVAFDALDLRRRPTKHQPLLRFSSVHGKPEWCRMHASCDGLILLSLSDYSTVRVCRLYVCNPATHQWIALPRLDEAVVAGMYSHSPTGEYRVLYWKTAHPPGAAFTAVYNVLTVGSAEPRCIGQPIAPPYSLQSFVELGPASLSIYGDGEAPVLLHDCLHWIRLNGWKLGDIVVFHTVNESFRMMRVPPGARGLHGMFWHLLDMDGTLAISWGSEHETVLKLWVLQDYETEAWSLKYRIEFPMLRMKCGVVEKDPGLRGMVVSKDGEALVHFFRYCSFQLFHLDSKGNILQTLQWEGLSLRHMEFRFKESLIKHDFFEGSREGAPLTEPKFFVGL